MKYHEGRTRRHLRLRKKISGTAERPRLVVSRSNAHVFAQIVDDQKGDTLVSASSYKASGTKIDQAKNVGESLAKAAKTKKIQRVVFDRGGNKYHGRIKALADGARSAGLEF
ncbi:MAG: 50S ribosomal protein L18 [Bifidobacteriaceae bacterium]|jgi:large subunit ribosomal protein L18|nr:50S ribosomal protein L18 [Bifidobacteriaceae bacterium]